MSFTLKHKVFHPKPSIIFHQPQPIKEISVKVTHAKTIKFQQTTHPIQLWLKRAVDILVSSILLILTSPILLIVAIAIKLDSKGSIFFIHERVGCQSRIVNGKRVWDVKTFRMFKFRSMRQIDNSEAHRKHIELYISGQLDQNKDDQTTIKAKMPVTRVGKFIRAWSIDELPQLLNVLLGDMTLVGPRPVPAYEVDGYKEWHYERLAALPGITGLWQVKGRCLLSFDEQIKLDITYARNQSVLFDLQILLMTIPAVLKKVGAA